jgi:hypothetical protein
MYDAQNLKYEQIVSAQATAVSDGGTPPPVAVVNLLVTTSTIEQGESATLSWSSSDATACTATGSWSGGRNTSGTEVVSPTATSTYSLTCNGGGGNSSDSVTVVVNQPPATNEPTLNLTAGPDSVSRGSTKTVSWSSTDANSCTASGNWSGLKATSGRRWLELN